eukprot:3604831-Amphidinium_carterae.2
MEPWGRMDLSSSDDEDFSWEALEPTKCPPAFKARGLASEQPEQEECDFYLKRMKKMWRVTLHLASKGLAERNSAGGKKRTGRRRASRLDRELPSPASPLFKKRRHVMRSLTEQVTLHMRISNGAI